MRIDFIHAYLMQGRRTSVAVRMLSGDLSSLIIQPENFLSGVFENYSRDEAAATVTAPQGFSEVACACGSETWFEDFGSGTGFQPMPSME